MVNLKTAGSTVTPGDIGVSGFSGDLKDIVSSPVKYMVAEVFKTLSQKIEATRIAADIQLE